jgi:hypothetical protein
LPVSGQFSPSYLWQRAVLLVDKNLWHKHDVSISSQLQYNMCIFTTVGFIQSRPTYTGGKLMENTLQCEN